MDSIRCKECDHEIYYKPCANFIMFCQKCLKYTYLECEFGYGSVAPCHIYLGKKKIGVVIEKEYSYFLKTRYADKIIKLERKYLEALQEAIKIIESKIEN